MMCPANQKRIEELTNEFERLMENKHKSNEDYERYQQDNSIIIINGIKEGAANERAHFLEWLEELKSSTHIQNYDDIEIYLSNKIKELERA